MDKTYIHDSAAGLETIRDPMIMAVGDTYYLTGTQHQRPLDKSAY